MPMNPGAVNVKQGFGMQGSSPQMGMNFGNSLYTSGAQSPKTQNPGAGSPTRTLGIDQNQFKLRQFGSNPPLNQLGPQTVRATGTGPFDQAYRQNLANYAGGLFSRPGGNLSFNPTGNLQDLGGQALGGGTAPLLGTPTSVLEQGLGGQGFTYNQPSAAAPSSPTTGVPSSWNPNFWQQWLGQYGKFLRSPGGM